MQWLGLPFVAWRGIYGAIGAMSSILTALFSKCLLGASLCHFSTVIHIPTSHSGRGQVYFAMCGEPLRCAYTSCSFAVCDTSGRLREPR